MDDKILVEDTDYKLDGNVSKSNTANITILTEDFKGVSVTFGSIKFGDENEDGTIGCNFDYEIIDRAGHKDLDDNPKFNSCLGNIMNSMLLTHLAASELNESIEDEVIIDE